MPPSKRRKTSSKTGSRSNSRAATPIAQLECRPDSPNATSGDDGALEYSDDLNPPLVLTSAKRRGVFECDYCHADISQLPRIRCAECPDFDLCLECFLTTDHTAAIARLKASVEARTAVDNLNHGPTSNPQAYYGKKGGPSASSWQTGSGAINHNSTHGYRVCDNTRYPMFPSSRKVMPYRPSAGADGTGSTTSKASGGEEAAEDEKNDDDDDMEIDKQEQGRKDTTSTNVSIAPSPASGLSHEVILIPDDAKAVWTVEEDLRLLDAIVTHGLGNWSDIAEAISGNGSQGKSPKRCMERYFDDFLGRYGHILPPYTLVEDVNEEKDTGDDNDSSKGGGNADGSGSITMNAGSVTKDMDPTRLSKRRHCIMVRTNSSTSTQSLNRFNKRLRPVPTESLPEFQVLTKAFPDPRVPKKEPEVFEGQDVARDQSAKAELAFVKAIGSVSKEEADRLRQQILETTYLKPGGPTVLPERPEDVVKMPGAELAGFMPRRGDFDLEWENDAEQTLADMEFLPGDPPEDKVLKLKVLQIYNEKLDEREKRKNFILERKLHDYKKNQEEDNTLPRDERELVRRMRLVERFHTPEEHKQFLADVLKAKALRKEIAKLQMYRRIGISSEVEAERYELDKKRRVFHKAAVLKESVANQGEEKDKSSLTAVDATMAPGKKVEPSDEPSLWKVYKENNRDRRRSVSLDGTPPTIDAGLQEPGGNDEGIHDERESPMNLEPTNGTSNGKQRDVVSMEFAIEGMEGFNFLSDMEANLCRRLLLPPRLYMEAKKLLILESLKVGLLDTDESNSRRTLVQIDIEKRGHVVDFMVSAGWLRGRPSAGNSS